jgi:hypothetical protein
VEAREADATLSPGGAAVVMALWAGLLVFSLWPVPGAIGGYAVAISMYIPLAALGGYGLGWIVEWIVTRLRVPEWVPAAALPLVAIVAALLTGTWHMIDLGRHSYVQWPDLEAFAWIKANTPADATFLISSEFSYQGRGLTGTDAGMWLPLLAERNVSVPALSSWVERPEDPDFFTNTRRLAAYTQPVGKPGEAGDSLQVNIAARGEIPAPASVTSPQALSLMRDLGITYVYSGAMQGHSTPRLDVEAMRGDPVHFRLVYFRDGVYVFQVVQ